MENYKLVSEINSGLSPDLKAVYQDNATGQKVFAKLSVNKYRLAHEFANARKMYALYKTHHDDNISVPEPLKLISNKNYTLALYSFADDFKNILNEPTTTKVNCYIRVTKWLNSLHPNKQFSLLSSFYQLASLPYFMVLNVYYFPSATKLVFKSIIHIVGIANKWLKLEHNAVAHGDLNSGNVNIKGDVILLLDFGQTSRSHQYWNMAQALNTAWQDTQLFDALMQKLRSEFNLHYEQLKILKSFVLFNLLQHLCKHYSNPLQPQTYIARISKLTHTNPKDLIAQELEHEGFTVAQDLSVDTFGRFHGKVKDSNEHEYFIKAVAKTNTYAYKSLQRECAVTKYLAEITHQSKIAKDKYQLRIPKVKSTIITEDFCVLVSEFIDGNNLLEQSAPVIAQTLLTTIDLVNQLGNVIDATTIKGFLKKYTIFNFYFSLPVRYTKALLLNPALWLQLTKTMLQTLGLLKANDAKTSLIHADINASNIIVKLIGKRQE
jgi:hypothetical protein